MILHEKHPKCRGDASVAGTGVGIREGPAVVLQERREPEVATKVDPCPGRLSKVMPPPIICASRWEIIRPSPVRRGPGWNCRRAGQGTEQPVPMFRIYSNSGVLP